MSIFGVKKQKITENDLTLRVNELHRRILPLAGLDQIVSQYRQENDNLVLEHINTQKDEHETIDNEIKEIKRNAFFLRGQVAKSIDESQKRTITISAESKGALVAREVFSFGNAGKSNSIGYVVMRRGHITGISVSSERSVGEIRVGVTVDGDILQGCEITLHTTPRKHDNFDNPFLVEAGSVINFISLGSNATTVNTVASLLFEF